MLVYTAIVGMCGACFALGFLTGMALWYENHKSYMAMEDGVEYLPAPTDEELSKLF